MRMVMESRMMVVKVKKKEMLRDFPKAKKWAKKIEKMRTGEDIFDKKKIEYYYTCTHPSTSGLDTEDLVTLPFDQRLELELGSIMINAMVKHNSFVIADLIPFDIVPDAVRQIVAEITKVKMMVECQITGDEEIRKTIPALDTNKVDPDMVRKSLDGIKMEEEDNLEIDNILDKIIDFGMDSLTSKEIEFLKKMGK